MGTLYREDSDKIPIFMGKILVNCEEYNPLGHEAENKSIFFSKQYNTFYFVFSYAVMEGSDP